MATLGDDESECPVLECTANATLRLMDVSARHVEIQTGIDVVWLLVTSIGILSLQLGFALLEAGTAQVKNVKAILLKNYLDTIVGTLVWWLFGFGIFSGPGLILGLDSKLYAVSIRDNDEQFFPLFVQQFGFAITSGTIVSGGVMSRMKLELYCLFIFFFVGGIYPMAAHWGFNVNGFLHKLGYLDFAGSGIVHMLGGLAGFVGAYLCGPRLERFVDLPDEGRIARPVKKHSTVLIVHGCFVLFIGWFSFNAGSSGSINAETVRSASIALMNTLLASGAAGVTGTLYAIFRRGDHDIPFIMNCFLCGLVAITGPCAFVETGAAVFIGATAALLFAPVSHVVLNKWCIDDPLDVSGVHGVSGAYGILLLGLFHEEEGLFYGGGFRLLGVQVLGIVVLAAWSGILSFILYKAMDKIWGLRVSEYAMREGLDKVYHKGQAYAFDTLAVGQKKEADRHRRQYTAYLQVEEIARQNLRDALVKTGMQLI